MTIDEALRGIGRIVIYDDGHGTREEGAMVDFRERADANGRAYGMAKVRYSHNDASIRATPIENLTFL